MCSDFTEGWCGHMTIAVEIVQSFLGRSAGHENVTDTRIFDSRETANKFVDTYNEQRAGGQGYWSGMPVYHARVKR